MDWFSRENLNRKTLYERWYFTIVSGEDFPVKANPVTLGSLGTIRRSTEVPIDMEPLSIAMVAMAQSK